MSKSYSDARKELEKIAVQRRNFILNSDSMKADFYNTQHSYDSKHRPSPQQNVQLSPRSKYADNSRISTPMSASAPPTNIYFRNEDDRAPSSSSMSPSLASFKKELEKSMPPYSSPAGVSQHFLSTLSPIPGLGTASSVISAFRQLQTRSRKIEQDRSAAMKERDDLRRQVEEHSQNLEMWRRQSEAQTSERFRSMKAASDELLLNRQDLELKMSSLQEALSSSQQSNSADRSVLLSLETEKADIRAIAHTVRSNVKTLRGELSLASNRCNRISGQIGTGTPATQHHKSQLAASIQSITREIDSAERSKVLVSMRCGALQHYMELILKINGDLTKRIEESEGIQSQIRDISDELSISKHTCLEQEDEEEEEDDSLADLDDVGEDNESQIDEGEHSAAAVSQMKLKSRPLSAPPRPRGSQQDLSRSQGTAAECDTRSSSVRGSRGGDGGGGGGVRFSMDSAYRALSADPNRRRANTARYRSSTTSSLNAQKGPVLVSSSSSSRRIEAVRCKGTSALSTSASRARATAWMANGGDPLRSLSRSKSPSSHPSRTTSTTGSLSGTSEQTGLLHLEERDTLFGQAVSAAALTRGGFIPGGNTEGKEFNVYANGSKLARATAHYNAAMASRVRAS